MPTGVVDVFKNLIRHGKHHNHNVTNHPKQVESSPPPSMTPVPSRSVISPGPREAAQIIVDEERQAHSKMPKYQGLENFELIDKMGESVYINPSLVLFFSPASSGAFSNVYKGIDRRTSMKVAVKVVRKYELNASQRSNILKVMEGGELFHQIVKLTYFSENLSRHVILQVAQGIRYLHEERGVVHRDIKPENLLFERIPIIPTEYPTERRPYDEEKEDEGQFIPGVGGGGIGRVKIADFGLSKVVWNEETMTPCGTVGYTAPEIVKDERYSKSVDMWALGCVLYTLLCGFPPFYDESINVLTEKVARGYYTFLSPWWDDISHSASPAPPPRPAPSNYANQPNTASSSSSYVASVPLDSPLLSAARGGRAHEGKSPGLTTLKEAFDITYAVHRMEEEGARRRKYNGVSAGPRGHLDALNEDEDDLSEEVNFPQSGIAGIGPSDRWRSSRGQHGTTRQQAASGHTAMGTSRIVHSGGFQLDLDNATLLGRRSRKARAGAAPAVSSPLSGKATGSPLRLEGLRMDDSSDPGNGFHIG
ncbi:hypothetical protein C0995_000856 [Termitomyces sp. Mi166|nr:hypothetical protein C0995_000856 [Termitomyces sp. Mi166\